MVYIWFIYGLYMVSYMVSYMVYIWFIYGLYMVYIWLVYGQSMDNLWIWLVVEPDNRSEKDQRGSQLG